MTLNELKYDTARFRCVCDRFNNCFGIVYKKEDMLSTDIYVQPDAMFVSENGKNVPGGENNIEIDIGDIIKWGTDYNGIVTADNIYLLYDNDRDYFAYREAAAYFTATYERNGTWHNIWVYDNRADWMVSFAEITLPIASVETDKPLSEYRGYIDYTQGVNSVKPEVYVFERDRELLYKGDLSYLDGSYKYYLDMGESRDYCAENASKAIAFYSGGHRFFIVYR